MKVITRAFILIIFICVSSQANAFNSYLTCPQNGITTLSWPDPNQQLFINGSGLSTSLESTITTMMERYSPVLGGTAFNVTTADATGSTFYGDGQNQVYVNFSLTGSIALAKIAFVSLCDNANNGAFIEGDIQFAANNLVGGQRRWTTNMARTHQNGRPLFIGTVALHELGHFAGSFGQGIDSAGSTVSGMANNFHERRIVDTMNNYPDGGYLGGDRAWNPTTGHTRLTPHGDTRGLLRFLYPSSNGVVNDVAGSRFGSPPVNNTIYRGDDFIGSTTISRGQGVLMPYTITNLGTQNRDVRLEVWMTNDGVLDGIGSDIQITNGGSPLYHLYTSPAGFNPDLPFPGSTPTTVDNNIWFYLPSSSGQLPSGSNWIIGFNVSMDGGITDQNPIDNWVAYRQIYTVN